MSGRHSTQRARNKRIGRIAAGAAMLVVIVSSPVLAVDLSGCERDDLPLTDVDACNAAISAQSKNALDTGRTYTLRGYAWLREGEPGGAVSDFSRALSLDDSNVSARRGRARALGALKRYDEAVADWTRLIAAHPTAGEGYRERAAALAGQGKTDAAFADYEKAIEAEPGNPESYIGRAQIYIGLGKRDEALREFDRAAAANPSYPNTYFTKAQAAESWGDNDMAIANYALVVRYKGDVWYAQRAMKRLGKQFSDLENHDLSGRKTNQ